MIDYERARKAAQKLAKSYHIDGDRLIVTGENARITFALKNAPAPGVYYARNGERMGDLPDTQKAPEKGEESHRIAFNALAEATRFCAPAAAKLGRGDVRPEFSKVFFDGEKAQAVDGFLLHTCRYGSTPSEHFGFYASDLKAFLAAFPANYDGSCVFTHFGTNDALECPDGSAIESLMRHTDALNYSRILPRAFKWQARLSSKTCLDLIRRYGSPDKGDKLAGYKGIAYRATFTPDDWGSLGLSVKRHDIVPECRVPFQGETAAGYALPNPSGRDSIQINADTLKASLQQFDPLVEVDVSCADAKQPLLLTQGRFMALLMPLG